MVTEVKRSIQATEKITQYDESVKRLLGQKSILAHIMVGTIDEFKGMNPDEVAAYIEGDPYIATVPLDPGQTNEVVIQNGERIVGLNTESKEVGEGVVYFDIIFYVRTKDGISQFIINVEPQKDIPSGYHILNRGLFYDCRMISSQKERDFVKSDYDDIKNVYSIWICMNMKENSLCHVHLMKEKLIGSYDWPGNIDMINVILIGLSKEPTLQVKDQELHRLLGTLLSKTLSAKEKCSIIEKEYRIPVVNDTEGDVGIMCNLGLGIYEDGIAQGMARGRAEATFNVRLELIKNVIDSIGKTAVEAMDILKIPENEREQYLQRLS